MWIRPTGFADPLFQLGVGTAISCPICDVGPVTRVDI